MKKIFACGMLLAASAACRRAPEPASLPPAPAVSVETAPIEERSMPRGLQLTGTLVANQQADVAANASGRVTRVFVERGQFVRAGEPLVQLDVRSAVLAEAQARADLETATVRAGFADAQCGRNEELFEKGAISRDEYEKVKTQCSTASISEGSARARARQAAQAIGDATVRAPFSGMIGERFLSVGEYATPASKVATLLQLDPLRLQLTVPESEVGKIEQGQAVVFDVAAFPDETFTGRVRYIGPQLRASGRDLVIEAVLPNADRRLRPGMFASARLQLPARPLPMVPKSALLSDGSGTRVFLVRDGHLEERLVMVGAERDGRVAILDGASAGESVVTTATDRLKDGASVR